MPCSQLNSAPSPGAVSYATEADCLQACKEGACCESNGTCNVRPQCQCQGAGQTFKGVGTVCSPNPCCRDSTGTPCFDVSPFPYPQVLYLTFQNTGSKTLNRTFTLTLSDDNSIAPAGLKYVFASTPVRVGEFPCTFFLFQGFCPGENTNPQFTVGAALALPRIQGQFIYRDYRGGTGGVCGCEGYPGTVDFNATQCWLCDPSSPDIVVSFSSYLTSHQPGTVQQSDGIARLSRNPLP